MAIKVRKIERLVKDLCAAGGTYRYPDITKTEYHELYVPSLQLLARSMKRIKILYIVIVFDHSEMNVVMISDIKASVYRKQIPSSELFDKLLESLPKDFSVSTFMIEDVFDLLKKCITLNIMCNPMTALVVHADKPYMIRPFMYGGAIGVWRN